jgi:small subunit ribosomal protein S2
VNQRKTVISIGIKELLEAGVHFGHQTRRWNPKMRPYIFEARNGIHIIDLSKTVAQLDAACEFLAGVARKGDRVLFVGTKKQAQQAVRESAQMCGQFYVTERWLGGTLTNFKTIKKSIHRLKEIEKMETDGTMAKLVKQEQSVLRREATRLAKYFDGIRAMETLPAALFVVDIKREHNAVAEGMKIKIPIVAIVDTNCDPDEVTHPIAGNDDAIRSLRLVLNTVVQAIVTGRAEYEAKYGGQRINQETTTEAPPAPAEPVPAAAAEPPAASTVLPPPLPGLTPLGRDLPDVQPSVNL